MFDEALIPRPESSTKPAKDEAKQIKKLLDNLDYKNCKAREAEQLIREQAEANAQLMAEMEIDLSLKECGWDNLRKGYELEYEVNSIITYLSKNGVIDKKMLFEPPFINIHDQGLLGVFDDADATRVIKLIDRVNGNAVVPIVLGVG